MGLLLIAAAALSWKGTFCVVRGESLSNCRTTVSPVVALAAEDRGVPFVWRSRGQIQVGAVSLGASEVRLDAGKPGNISLTVAAPEGSAPRIVLKRRETVWPIDIAVGKLSITAPPADRYTLSIEGEDLEPLRRDRLQVEPAKTTELGDIHVRRYPTISGVVLRQRDGKAIPGAVISDSQGGLLATTSSTGAFSFRRREAALRSITVASSGYATHVQPLDEFTSDRQLSPIQLADGFTLKVAVRSAQDTQPAPVVKRVRLLEIGGWGSPAAVAEKSSMEHGEVELAGLEPASYILELDGTQPLEKLMIPVDLHESRTVEAVIDPIDLTITASIGNVPQPNAVIEVAALRAVWKATINTGATASYTGRLWQRGLFAATVQIANSKFRTSRTIGNTSVGEWNIDIPDHSLIGSVRDEESGQPVPGTVVQYDFYGPEESVRGAHLDVDDNGRFGVFGARAGTYVIHVTAPEHEIPEPIRLTVDEGDNERHIDVILKKEATRTVVLVDRETGEFIAGAPVVELLPDGRSIARMLTSDGSGTVHVTFDGKQSKTLYVLPPAGSLKVARLTGRDREDPVQIEVPPAVSSIQIKARFDDGVPFRNCRVLMRIDGELIPPVIMELYSSIHHVPVMSSASGEISLPAMPAGLYEFWPYLASSIPAPKSPPVRANVEPGPATILLTFDRQNG